MTNRFLLESQHIDELKAAQTGSILSDSALKLYGDLNLDLIQDALAIAATPFPHARISFLEGTLRLITTGREVRRDDGTTEMVDIDDPAKVAADALAAGATAHSCRRLGDE